MILGSQPLIVEAKAAGVPWDPSDYRVGPAVLILETADRYVIAESQGRG